MARVSGEFIDSLCSLAQSESGDVFLARLAALDCPPRYLIRVLLLTSQVPLGDLFVGKRAEGFAVSRLARGSKISAYALEHRYGLKERKSQKGEFFVIESAFSFVFLVVTVSEWAFWDRAVVPFIQKMYPSVARVFLSQEELYRMVRSVREAGDDLSIRILKVSSRRRLKAHGARRRFETDIRWTDRPLDVVFKEAAQENIWFRSVTFEVGRMHAGQFDSLGIEASISKYGSVFTNAFFAGLFRAAISPMAALASEKMQFFMERERRKVPDKPPRPIVVSFPSDVFRSPDDTKRFVALMRRMTNASCTVLHGNPYVHLSLVDNADGSSMRLWVLRPNEVTIIPQIKTSDAALKRVVNHVFEEWAEGSITEPKG